MRIGDGSNPLLDHNWQMEGQAYVKGKAKVVCVDEIKRVYIANEEAIRQLQIDQIITIPYVGSTGELQAGGAGLAKSVFTNPVTAFVDHAHAAKTANYARDCFSKDIDKSALHSGGKYPVTIRVTESVSPTELNTPDNSTPRSRYLDD